MNKLNSIADACWDEVCKASSTFTDQMSSIMSSMSKYDYTGYGYTGYILEDGVLKTKDKVFISPSQMQKCYVENKDKICDCCRKRGMKSCCSYVGNETLNFCGNSCDLDDGSYGGDYTTGDYTKLKPITTGVTGTSGYVDYASMNTIPEVWDLNLYLYTRAYLYNNLSTQIPEKQQIDCILNKLVELYPNPRNIDYAKLTQDNNVINTIKNCISSEPKSNIPNILLINNGEYPSTWNETFYNEYKNFLRKILPFICKNFTESKLECIMDNIVIQEPKLLTKNLKDIEDICNNCIKRIKQKKSFFEYIWVKLVLSLFIIIVLILITLGIARLYGKNNLKD